MALRIGYGEQQICDAILNKSNNYRVKYMICRLSKMWR